jgi:hypothetical protein
VNDDLLREAMKRAAARGEPTPGDAFARFVHRRKRTNVVRTTVVLGTIGAGLAMLLRTLPGPFGSGPPADFHAGGGLQPQQNTVQHYIDSTARFELDFQGTWRASGLRGRRADFSPSRESLTTWNDRSGTRYETPNAFYVRVWYDADVPPPCPAATSGITACTPPDWPEFPGDMSAERAAGARVTQSRALVAGDAATRYDIAYPKRDPRAPISYWCAGCRRFVIEAKPWNAAGHRLVVSVVAPDEKTFSDYAGFAEKIIDSIRSYTPPARS